MKEFFFFSQKIPLCCFNFSFFVYFTDYIIIDILKVRFTNFRKLDWQSLEVLYQTLTSPHINLIKMQKLLVATAVPYNLMIETKNLLVIQVDFLQLKF